MNKITYFKEVCDISSIDEWTEILNYFFIFVPKTNNSVLYVLNLAYALFKRYIGIFYLI